MNTTFGISESIIHIVPGSERIGINAAKVVSVQIISGDLNSFNAINTAVLGLNHSFIFSVAHSTIIIIVSIAIQKDKTKAKFVIKLRLCHCHWTTINESKNASGNKSVAITASLTQTKKIKVRKTIIIVTVADPIKSE